MTERALTEEAIQNGLQDIRLPADAPGGLLAEMLAMIGLALLVALVIGTLLRTLSLTRPKTSHTTVSDQITALSALPEESQQLALLGLLKSNRPGAYQRLRPTLYRRGGLPSLAQLKKEVWSDD